MISDKPEATIAICTFNRKDELVRAVQSSLAQVAPVEVIVMDDGSTDGTAEEISRRFPQVRLFVSARNVGLVEQRNQAARLARAPIIVVIDDDAVFTSTLTVGQTLDDFDDPRIGAVAIPYVDVLVSDLVQQKQPDDRVWICSSYRGTAHAIRRDLFQSLAGYRSYLYRQGEEADYCIRMIDRGFHTRLGTADPIHHFESPSRNATLISHYSARNRALMGWNNAPLVALPLHLLSSSIRSLRAGIKVGHHLSATRGIIAACFLMINGRAKRKPVSWRAYWLFRILRKNGPYLLSSLRGLPARSSGRVPTRAMAKIRTPRLGEIEVQELTQGTRKGY